MNYKEALEIINGLPTNISVLLVGKHGIGKSCLVKQLANEKNIPLIDIRLAECEPGDLKGLPYIVNSKTYFATPDFFPIHDEDREEIEKILGVKINPSPKEGILFFDELNRANRDVQQAVFEIILDRRLSGKRIQEGWRIFSAINDDDSLYQVIALDPALLSRFCVIKLNPTVEEWLEWAEGKISPVIISFIKNHPDLLDPTKAQIESCVANMEIIPSRRSWAMFSEAFEKMQDKDKNKVLLLASTFVGSSVALRFADFFEQQYKVLSAEEILNNIENIAQKIKEASVAELAEYNKRIIQYLKVNKITGKISKNLIEYLKMVPESVVGEFWSSALSQCSEVISNWYNSNKEAKEVIVKAFKIS